MSFTAEQLIHDDSNIETVLRATVNSVLQQIDTELKKNRNEKKLIYRMPHDLQHYNNQFSIVRPDLVQTARAKVVLSVIKNLKSRGFEVKFKIDPGTGRTTIFYIDWSHYANVNIKKEFEELTDELAKYMA